MSVRRVALGALAALLLAACTGSRTEGITRGGSVIGETLTVYSLLPSPDRGLARDLVDGQRLALSRAGGRAGAYKVNFASLDLTADATASELPGQVASATRRTIADAQVVAAIGDLSDDTARVTVPLLNSAGILHVSPGVTYPGFTRQVEPGEPGRWYPAGERTFFPLVPDAEAQARALADELRGRVLVEQESSAEGEALGRAVRAALGAGRLADAPGSARTAVYAGTDPANARGVIESLLREDRRVEVVLPPAFAGSALGERPRVRVLRAGTEPDAGLRREFRAAFGREPTPAAAAGALAMRGVLDAIARAGARAASRQAIIDAYRASPPPALALSLEPR